MSLSIGQPASGLPRRSRNARFACKPTRSFPVERPKPIPQQAPTPTTLPMGRWPMGESPSVSPYRRQSTHAFDFPSVTPYIEVEGRGKRPLRYCRTVQDGHTSSEQVAYQALWSFARRLGQSEPEGSQLMDIGLARICQLLGSDHKNIKRILQSLEAKLAIEVVERPDYRLGLPTRYRIFAYAQILERRRRAGMLWVVRTRTTRFVDLGVVRELIEAQNLRVNSPWVIFLARLNHPWATRPFNPWVIHPNNPWVPDPWLPI